VSKSEEPRFEVVAPAGRHVFKVSESLVQIADLTKARIAFIWDYVFRGDEMFDVIEARMTKSYPGIDFLPYSEFGDVHGSSAEAVIARLRAKLIAKQADGVVIGVGA
jgi:hypothetical protein